MSSSLTTNQPSRSIQPRMEEEQNQQDPLIVVPVLPPDITPSLPRFPCPPGFTVTPGVIEIGREALDEVATSTGAQLWLRNLVGQGGIFFYGQDFLGRRFTTGVRFALSNQKVLDVAVRAARRRSINGQMLRIVLILPDVTGIAEYSEVITSQLSRIWPDREVQRAFYPFDLYSIRSSRQVAYEYIADPNQPQRRLQAWQRKIKIPTHHRSKSVGSALDDIAEGSEND